MRWLLIISLLFGALGAEAHQRRTVRKVMFTARPTASGMALDLAVWMRLGGHHARRTLLRFDLDKSGDLNAGEAAYLGNELAPKALGGLYLNWRGRTLIPTTAKSNARRVDDDTAEVMSLLTYELVGRHPGELNIAWREDAGRSTVSVVEGATQSPLTFLSSAGFRTALVQRGLTADQPLSVTLGVYPDLMDVLIWTLRPHSDAAHPPPEGSPTH